MVISQSVRFNLLVKTIELSLLDFCWVLMPNQLHYSNRIILPIVEGKNCAIKFKNHFRIKVYRTYWIDLTWFSFVNIENKQRFDTFCNKENGRPVILLLCLNLQICKLVVFGDDLALVFFVHVWFDAKNLLFVFGLHLVVYGDDLALVFLVHVWFDAKNLLFVFGLHLVGYTLNVFRPPCLCAIQGIFIGPFLLWLIDMRLVFNFFNL